MSVDLLEAAAAAFGDLLDQVVFLGGAAVRGCSGVATARQYTRCLGTAARLGPRPASTRFLRLAPRP